MIHPPAPRTRALTLPLIVLMAVLLAVAGALNFSLNTLQAARQQFGAQQAQLREAQTRVYQSGAEKERIVRYLPGYQQLAALGFVGEEQRINWLNALRVVNQKGGWFGVDYEISPRRPYIAPIVPIVPPPLLPPPASPSSPSPPLATGTMHVMQSVMKLRFQLLHEEDLPAFFDLLSKQQAGLFLLDQCTLRRTAGSAAPAPTLRFQPNLAADCQVSWITAQPSAPAEQRP